MVGVHSAVALAARAHERDGRVSISSAPFSRLRAAAAEMGQTGAELIGGPSADAGDGVLVLPLTTPDAVLAVVLRLASLMRPFKTTFCAAIVPTTRSRSGGGAQSVDAALLAADRAAGAAAAGIADTDPRDSRIVVLGPGPEALVAALIDLIIEAYDSMTERQRQIVDLVKQSETQQQVAGHLGVSRQAVNQSLGSAGWPHLERAEETARGHLASLPAPHDDG
jgi:hypothetical protein